jgi:hypothetical protein
MPSNTPAFLETTFNPEGFVFDTKVAFIPAGEYEAELIRINDGTYTNKETGEQVPAIRVQWRIEDPAIKESMGIDDPQVSQFVQLELDASGNVVIARNRNTRLAAQLLDPLGFNKGKKWSFPQLLHARAWVRVELPRDEERSLFSNVVAVGAKKTDVERRGRSS